MSAGGLRTRLWITWWIKANNLVAIVAVLDLRTPRRKIWQEEEKLFSPFPTNSKAVLRDRRSDDDIIFCRSLFRKR
jgi:hypothetical protein